MYISVNRDTMEFMYKHEQHDVICNLAWIERQEAALYVFELAGEGFQDFTNMELMLLMGGGHAPEFVKTWGRTQLIEALVAKGEAVPVVDVWVYELDTQAKHVPESTGERYQYVKGANRAAIVDKLFS